MPRQIKMNVLLIYPKMPNTFWNMSFLSSMLGKKSDYPPLGLLTVAALLPVDWDIKILDLNAKKMKPANIIWADMIFIGAMNVQIDSVHSIVKEVKNHGKTIVAGGPLFVHDFEHFPEIDHFVLNEAEITLPHFLSDLKTGNLKRIYKSKEFVDLHTTPIPRYDLINITHYAYGIIQYSRGCPFQCDFCDVTQLYGKKTRTKDSSQIILELSAMGNLNALDLVLFADDNLIGNKKQLKDDLLPALIKWRKETQPKVTFATQVSINLANDDELMNLMLEAGFRHVFIGIETPEESSLLASNKNQNINIDLKENIRKLHRKGFVVTGGFIVGFDTDTDSIFENQASLIQESGVVISTLNLLKAPGGTMLHERMENENRLLSTTNFDEQRINFVPRMPVGQLYHGFGNLLKEVLLPDKVFIRIKRFMKDYRGAQVVNKINRTTQARDIATFFRILLHLGILSKNRKQYWILLRWGLKNYPGRLDQIFLFIVLSEHFHQLYNRFISYENSQEHKQFIKMVKDKQESLKL